MNVEEVVNKFLELFDSIRLVAPKDEYPIAGHRFLTSMVRSFVETNQPIGLVLPAFPAKSPNVVKKVLGPLPGKQKLARFQYSTGELIMSLLFTDSHITQGS